ncbi:hypothetical protein DEU56DRAFT_730223, partial [Suillus clintonianus]|uniref:uncharacterized protein n=1 Tax=Suillus clintonianus TaxID=1904413 RepID=UPI001B868236
WMRYVSTNMLYSTNDCPGPIARPGNILDDWPLRQVGFGFIDAILPVPDDHPQAYFFSRDESALIQLGSSPGGVFLVESPETTVKD